MSSRRDRLRTETTAEIKRAAMDHVRRHGGVGLSLRAVARDAGISAPGIYRYFDSREALLTALIADAYLALAASLRAAAEGAGDLGARARLGAAALAYRRWAVANRNEFGLIFGDPIPGYAAPPDGPTTEGMMQVGAAFVAPIIDAWREGTVLVPRPDPAIDTAFSEYAASLDPDLPPQVVGVVLRAWGRIHGLVALELNGQFDWILADVDPLYRAEVAALLDDLLVS